MEQIAEVAFKALKHSIRELSTVGYYMVRERESVRERLDDRGRVLELILNLEAFGQFLHQTIWIYFPAHRD